MEQEKQEHDRTLTNAEIPEMYIWTNYSFYNSSFRGDINDSGPFHQISDAEKFLLDFIYVLDEFGVPILLTIGVIANLILSITIRKSELKKVSACFFFFALGIVDTLYLIVMAIPWVSRRVVDIYNMKGFCQLVYYLNLLTTFLSSWYVVLLLFERLIVCYRPDTARKYFNAFRTKCYITAMSIFSIVGHLYLTWTSGVFYRHPYKKNMCMVIQENLKDIVTMRKIDTVLAFIIPVALCIILMLPLIVYLCASVFKCNNGTLRVRTKMITVEVRLNSKRKRKRYTECPTCSSDKHKDHQKQRLLLLAESRRLTVTTIIIALVYVILAIPHNVIKAKIVFLNGDYIVTFEDSTLLKLFEELYKINFVHKALVYYLLIPEMRKNIVNIFLSCCRRTRKRKEQQKCIVTTL